MDLRKEKRRKEKGNIQIRTDERGGNVKMNNRVPGDMRRTQVSILGP